MSGRAKYRGHLGIARAATSSTVVAPKMFGGYESAQLEGVPVITDRVNSISADPIGHAVHGKDHTWRVNNLEPNAEMFGYLWWLALGNISSVTTTHTIVPQDASEFACIQLARIQDLGTSTPAQAALGARVGSISLEIPRGGYARMGVGGMYCRDGAEQADFTPSLPSGADEAPLSWGALNAGNFQVNVNGAGLATDNNIQGLQIEYEREQQYAGQVLDDDQPDEINEHMRTLRFRIRREFTGAEAKAMYEAWKNAQEVAIDAAFTIGAFAARVEILHADVEENYMQEIGTGAESIMAELVCRAVQAGSDPLIRVITTDVVSGDYT